MQRKIRVLVGKPGLDGHDRGAKVVAASLRDGGMEVIYTGLHQTPEQIVEAAVQEDVDVVALSVLSGAHMTLFPEIFGLMRERGIADRLLTGGGIIPGDDMNALLGQGIGKLFGPGTNTHDIVRYIRDWYAGVHGADALPPLPLPPARPAPLVGASDRLTPTRAEARHHTPKPATPAGQTAPRATAKKTAKKVVKKAAKKVAKKAAKRAAKKAPKKAPKQAPKRAAVARKPAKKQAAPKKKSRR